MSAEKTQDKSAYNKRFFQNPPQFKSALSTSTWVRNPSWLSLPSMTSSDSKFIGLVAVYKDTSGGEPSNFLALTAAADYTVDWGDGTVENYSSGTNAYHIYDYTDSDLSNTNAPVTLTDSGDKIERTAHGYTNGMIVRFYNIVSTTGITEGQIYYVINANANDFQISATKNGSAIALTTNGSATLLNYKQAIVVVTPQVGNNLTSIDITVRHNQANLQNYNNGWLDIKLGSPNFTSITINSNNYTSNYNIEQVNILNCGSTAQILFTNLQGLKNVSISNSSSLSDASNMFAYCYSLEYISVFDTSSIASMNSMFYYCRSLKSVPLFDTSSATDMLYMFYECSSLTTVPLFNTSNVANMSSMFDSCRSLTTVPLLDTSSVTDMSYMFNSCFSLLTIPAFNTSLVSNMQSMFRLCYDLNFVPLLDTSSVTNMSYMFNNCYSLTLIPKFNTSLVSDMSYMFSYSLIASVPLLDTSSVVDMSSMFTYCSSLIDVPLFDTSSVIYMLSMFSNCTSLTTIPLFDTSSVTNMNAMFTECYSLNSIPLLDTSSVTQMSYMFNQCYSLISVPLLDTSSVTYMGYMFANCSALTEIPAFNTSSVTDMSSMFTYCSSLTSLPLFDTSSVTDIYGMFYFCNSLISIPAYNASNFVAYSTFLLGNSSLCDINMTGYKYSHGINNCKLSKTALKKYMDNLGVIGSPNQTINISYNWGVGSNYIKTVTPTAQSTTVTCSNTSNLASGMMMTGSGTGLSTGIRVTSDVTAETLTLNNHGLVSGTPMSFSASGTTGGISLNTIYYPVDITTNNFKVAATSGGSAINLTGTNSTMTLKYGNYITSINPNVSITLNVPAASGATNASWTFRTVDSYGALLKGWSVTY